MNSFMTTLKQAILDFLNHTGYAFPLASLSSLDAEGTALKLSTPTVGVEGCGLVVDVGTSEASVGALWSQRTRVMVEAMLSSLGLVSSGNKGHRQAAILDVERKDTRATLLAC